MTSGPYSGILSLELIPFFRKKWKKFYFAIWQRWKRILYFEWKETMAGRATESNAECQKVVFREGEKSSGSAGTGRLRPSFVFLLSKFVRGVRIGLLFLMLI